MAGISARSLVVLIFDAQLKRLKRPRDAPTSRAACHKLA
jgi:hypothetical protein